MKHNPFVLMIAAAMGIVALPAAAETLCGDVSAQTGVDLTSGTRTARATETIVYSPFWAAESGGQPSVTVCVNETGQALVTGSTDSGTYAWTTPTVPGTYTLQHETYQDYKLKDTLTATFEVLAEVTVADVTGATYAAYTNDAPATVPFVVSAETPIKVVYTADEGKMFPGGYKTFETNFTATAKAITVALAADQQPVAAAACADCLTFSADAAFGIKMRRQGSPAEPNLECSQDQIYWSKFDLGNGAAAGADNTLYLRGTGNKKIASNDYYYYTFTNTTDSTATAIACSGDIMTLLDYQTVAAGEEPKMDEYAFNCLFSGFSALTAAPELSATNLTSYCYNSMFKDCTSLTDVPELPAMMTAYGCYGTMFGGCTSLTDVPALPATNLAGYCYNSMFKGCTSLEVNTNAPGKAWSIPAEATTTPNWSAGMFKDTAGDITNTTVAVGVTYYVKSAIKLVTVTVPEVGGATAELFTFNVNGGWTKVEADKVPSNSTVRVLWTADDGKGLTGEGAANAFEWQAEFGPVVGGETAPAPTVSAEGVSEVTIALDTRTKKSYFRAEDILPIWYAAGAEAKVKGEGEQSWETLVKSSATTNTLNWTPTEPDTYTLSQTPLENATIIYALPVEVTTNGLEHADTTFAVADEDGKPLEPQADFGGKLIVASNSTVKVTYTVTTPGLYFANGTTTYTATFTADKSVNDAAKAIADQQPEGPDKPTMKFGVVGQRYPWSSDFDIEYKVTFWPKGSSALGEVLIDGKRIRLFPISPSGAGTYIGKVLTVIPAGTKGKVTVRVVK